MTDEQRYKQALEYMAGNGCSMPEPCIPSAGRDSICFACYAKLVLKGEPNVSDK